MRISTLFSCQYLILNFPHRVCTYENIDLLTIAHCFLIRYAHRPASFGYTVMGDGAQPTYFMPEFSVAVMSLTRLADHSEYALFIMALRTWTIQ